MLCNTLLWIDYEGAVLVHVGCFVDTADVNNSATNKTNIIVYAKDKEIVNLENIVSKEI